MKNTNRKNMLILLAGLVAIVAIAGVALNMSGGTTPDARPAAAVSETAPVEETAQTLATEETVASASSLDYGSASLPAEPIGERTLGNPDAPIRIEEFSSLTCPHCAHFHRDTFAALKEKYIDTGKVFFVFTDFPLNAPALDGAMIARCMPPERYFAFIAFLYESQDKWAFDNNYRAILKQNAKLAGMSDERFESCLADTALKEGLVQRMQERAEKHSVKSTPSFVINGQEVVTGALPIATFDELIEKATGQPENAPADTGKEE